MNLTNLLKSVIHINPPKFSPKKFGQFCLDLMFPRHCLGCKKDGAWLCSNCLEDLPRSYSPIEDKIFSVFEYGSPVMKQVVWRLKYKRSLELATTLARPMYETLLEELQDELLVTKMNQTTVFKNSQRRSSGTIILIPAPLSPARYRFRGYNQAEELARQIARLNPDQFVVRTDLVKKTKDTPSQVSIRNRDQRLANLKGAFALTSPTTVFKNSQRPSSGTIFVIIDDVSTTGATIGEIRQLLARPGPAGGGVNPHRIYGLVVAHG